MNIFVTNLVINFITINKFVRLKCLVAVPYPAISICTLPNTLLYLFDEIRNDYGYGWISTFMYEYRRIQYDN